ncbi:unnamed protein product [Protopolystoma xenopodis]|uniref:Uncharacterized protein n=1 Tax=Protopolystoma xenopodis TaxID=117903 RepID=A0A448WJS9_9PLAT|nr:unnamed protein product [Protopolystoma xenopodis]
MCLRELSDCSILPIKLETIRTPTPDTPIAVRRRNSCRLGDSPVVALSLVAGAREPRGSTIGAGCETGFGRGYPPLGCLDASSGLSRANRAHFSASETRSNHAVRTLLHLTDSTQPPLPPHTPFRATWKRWSQPVPKRLRPALWPVRHVVAFRTNGFFSSSPPSSHQSHLYPQLDDWPVGWPTCPSKVYHTMTNMWWTWAACLRFVCRSAATSSLRIAACPLSSHSSAWQQVGRKARPHASRWRIRWDNWKKATGAGLLNKILAKTPLPSGRSSTTSSPPHRLPGYNWTAGQPDRETQPDEALSLHRLTAPSSTKDSGPGRPGPWACLRDPREANIISSEKS